MTDSIQKLVPVPKKCKARKYTTSSSPCGEDATYLINGEPHCALHTIKYTMYQAQNLRLSYNHLVDSVAKALKNPTETHLFAALDNILACHHIEPPVYEDTDPYSGYATALSEVETPLTEGVPVEDFKFPPEGYTEDKQAERFEKWVTNAGDVIKDDL